MKSYRTMCKKTWAVILAIACHLPATWATNANEIEIIPKPVHVEQTSGNFRLSPKSTIGYDAALQGQAEYLQQVLGQSTGWDLKLKKDARKATILLTLNPEKVDKPEGYRLDVTPKGISLTGRDAGGIFYGIYRRRCHTVRFLHSRIYHVCHCFTGTWREIIKRCDSKTYGRKSLPLHRL